MLKKRKKGEKHRKQNDKILQSIRKSREKCGKYTKGIRHFKQKWLTF
jgi:hypothetical protein